MFAPFGDLEQSHIGGTVLCWIGIDGLAEIQAGDQRQLEHGAKRGMQRRDRAIRANFLDQPARERRIVSVQQQDTITGRKVNHLGE